MISFLQFVNLQEALDRPMEYQWSRRLDRAAEHGSIHARFKIPTPNGILKYIVSFTGWPHFGDYGSIWTIAFGLEKEDDDGDYLSNDIENTGVSLQVFATVYAAVAEFIKTIKPENFKFQAKEPSRQKLYRRFVKQLGPKFPRYTATEKINKAGELVFYFLDKDGLPPLMNETV